MGTAARRTILKNIRLDQQRFPHAGLWLDKFLPEQTEQGGENVYTPHFSSAATIPVAPAYHNFFVRWEQTLKEAGARTARATTLGRLVVGLGADSVLENAITLHRTYGVPVIPGSALKGLAAAYARNHLQDEAWHVKTDQKGKIIYMGEAYRILFGDADSAGYVTFFDALYHPDGSPKKPLVMDVVTVHHQGYYQDKNEPPADWDSPNPVPFVSVRDGVKFLVALAGPDEWVDAAFQILKLAL
ncbi:type III-B CRISPR module RAMP protein Cmr6, partial [Candidatus Parcubacteria bacterium]